MIEIEVKAPSNPEAKKKIKKEAKFIKKIDQRDTYLNHPSKDFSKTDEALRLRKIGKEVFLTYKGPKMYKKTKTRKEIEEKVEDHKKTLEIFKSLGFSESGEVTKKREIYELNDYKISIDNVKDLGEFIEVEKETETADKDMMMDIIDFLKKMSLHEDDLIRESYLELLINKNENN